MKTQPFRAANCLADAQSLYLRQHAQNPVHWQRWGQTALAYAKTHRRLILVSSGYAACHWCHVMAEESFADRDIAAIMNRHYVSIKLDREERPEIDAMLMEALHLLGRPGGWPLTMFLTPDGHPFWGGTYFAKPLFGQLLNRIAALHEARPEEIEAQSKNLVIGLRGFEDSARPKSGGASEAVGANEIEASLNLMDKESGGVAGNIKFPCLPMGEYLWLAGQSGHGGAAAAAGQLAQALCRGGICDQIGGGFFRYATDRDWRWPHFEKMLYDNGLALSWLAMAAKEGGYLLRRKALETGNWLLREMQLPQGGFAAALDADQKDGEGAYYLWEREAIEAALPPVLTGGRGDFFFHFFALTPNPDGKGGLPYLSAQPQSAREIDRLAELAAALAEARAGRAAPARDEKLLADSNGLAIEGLARAGFLLGEESFIAAAAENWDKIFPLLWNGDRLGHCTYHRTSSPPTPAIADDYVFMISAALTLFEASGEQRFLTQAYLLAESFDRDYWDKAGGGYFYSAPGQKNGADVLLRRKHAKDSPAPSANGKMIANCARLAALAPDGRSEKKWQSRATSLLELFGAGDRFAGAGLRAGAFWRQNLATLAGMVDDEAKQVLRENWFPGLVLTHKLNPSQPEGSFILCRGEICLTPAQTGPALAAQLTQTASQLAIAGGRA